MVELKIKTTTTIGIELHLEEDDGDVVLYGTDESGKTASICHVRNDGKLIIPRNCNLKGLDCDCKGRINIIKRD